MGEKKWYEQPVVCSTCNNEFLRHQYNQKTCLFCLRELDKRFSLDKIIKVCDGCGNNFIRGNPLQTYCSSKCRAENSYLKRNYGISKLDYDIMLSDQNNVCAICSKNDITNQNKMHKNLVVDHCHSSGEVRGLLCHKCNQGLGLFGDDIDVLQQAIFYLSESRKV